MVPAPVRLAALVLVVRHRIPATARQDGDPEVDGKKASEWFSILRTTRPPASERRGRGDARATLWLKHQHKDALPDLVRS